MPVTYAMPGEAKVTWLDDPLMSNHRVMADGYGHAVDLGSWPYGSDPKAYRAIWIAMSAASKIEGVKIRAGIDWDGDAKLMEKGESDLGHYEILVA